MQPEFQQPGLSPPPRVKGPRVTQIILTLVAFFILLCAIGGAGFLYVKKTNKALVSDDNQVIPSEVTGFFYNTIGNAQLPSKTNKVPTVSYTLEIKMASSREEAEALIDMLQGMDVQAYYTPVSVDGRVVYRIRRGIFPSTASARKAANQLKQSKNLATKVVKLQ